MDRRTLGLILAVTPIIAVIIALAAAFALTGDVQVKMSEKGPEGAISGYLGSVKTDGKETFEVSGYSYAYDSGTLFLNVTVKNRINQTFIINNISYPTEIDGNQVTMTLGKPEEIRPYNSTEITFKVDLHKNKKLLKIDYDINLTQRE